MILCSVTRRLRNRGRGMLRPYDGPFRFAARFWFRSERAAFYAHAARSQDAWFRLHGAQQSCHFGIGKRTMAPGSERLERQISDCDTFSFFDGVASLKKTVAQGVASRFGKGHFIPRSILALDAHDVRSSGARQVFDFFKSEESFQFQVI